MGEKKMISIIIPAHNEAGVIKYCLEQLVQPFDRLGVEIIVVCNGCSDDTADVVRGFDHVKCIETEVALKTHALNLGDQAASFFPRFYLDADIRLSFEDVLKVVIAMQEQNALAGAPMAQMDFTGSSWAVKSYYDIWCNLPYCREGMIGAGVYVISEEGRKRFTEFPNIHCDGLFIRDLFKGNERIGVKGAVSIVSAPTNLAGLIKIMTRSRLGIYEFKKHYPELMKNEGKEYGTAMKEVIRQVHRWPKAFVYLSVNLISRMRARQQSITMGYSHWERDDSSREKMK